MISSVALLMLLAWTVGLASVGVRALADAVTDVKSDTDLVALRWVRNRADSFIESIRPVARYGLPLLAVVVYSFFLLRLPVRAEEEKEDKPKKPVEHKKKENA